MDEIFEKSYFRSNWKDLVSKENKLIKENRFPDENKEFRYYTNPKYNKHIF